MSPERCLLVALDTSAQSLAALEMGVELASMGGCSMKGVYIEEKKLQDACLSSISREVELATTSNRSFDMERLASIHRAQAAHARQAIEMASERRRIDWEFEVRHGVASEVIQELGKVSEMVLMGSRSMNWGQGSGFGSTALPMITRYPGSLFLARKSKSLAFPLTVVCCGFEANQVMLKLAFDLGQLCHHYVHVVYLPTKKADDEAALRHWLTQISEDKGVIFRMYVVESATRMHLLGFLESFKPGTLIFPELNWCRQKRFIEAVQRLDCPILFYRPAAAVLSPTPVMTDGELNRKMLRTDSTGIYERSKQR